MERRGEGECLAIWGEGELGGRVWGRGALGVRAGLETEVPSPVSPAGLLLAHVHWEQGVKRGQGPRDWWGWWPNPGRGDAGWGTEPQG